MKNKELYDGPDLFNQEKQEAPAKPVYETHEPVDKSAPVLTKVSEKQHNINNIEANKMNSKTKPEKGTTTLTITKSAHKKLQMLAHVAGMSQRDFFAKLIDERFALEKNKIIENLKKM